MSSLNNPFQQVPYSFQNCTNGQYSPKANTAYTFLAANNKRLYALIMNTSYVPVTIILGSTANAVIGQGIILNPGASVRG